MAHCDEQDVSKQSSTTPPEGNNVPKVTYVSLEIALKSGANLNVKTSKMHEKKLLIEAKTALLTT